jgi:hypothetical protein
MLRPGIRTAMLFPSMSSGSPEGVVNVCQTREPWRTRPSGEPAARPWSAATPHGLQRQAGEADRLTSSPKGVDSDPIGSHGGVCLSGRTWDVRRMAMATNGEWKVLVDLLYGVA